MSDYLQFSFSEKVEGVIWKIVADPDNKRLYLEIRDNVKKRVSFSALSVFDKIWLWKDITFDEPWWIDLQTVSGNILLFTIYTDTSNPDKKSVLAFDIIDQKMIWWRSNFTVTSILEGQVLGIDTKFGAKEIRLNLRDGVELNQLKYVSGDERNFSVIRPLQYREGSAYFETVKAFLESKFNFSPIISIEYCEYHSLILISAFTGPADLANYLFVVNTHGELLIKETLGEHLTGIALDTFFIFSGYLIFVKNKCELVSYKIV